MKNKNKTMQQIFGQKNHKKMCQLWKFFLYLNNDYKNTYVISM